LRNHPTKPAMQ